MPREVLRMEIALECPTPAAEPPQGVTLRPAVVRIDARPVHALLSVAFAGTESAPIPYDEWLEWWTTDPEWDPTAWFVAEVTGELAGAALCWSSGFLKDLAVEPAYRRRGIGRALLLYVFDEFRTRGAPTVSLKVNADNTTGAVRVYEAAGMRVVERQSGR